MQVRTVRGNDSSTVRFSNPSQNYLADSNQLGKVEAFSTRKHVFIFVGFPAFRERKKKQGWVSRFTHVVQECRHSLFL